GAVLLLARDLALPPVRCGEVAVHLLRLLEGVERLLVLTALQVDLPYPGASLGAALRSGLLEGAQRVVVAAGLQRGAAVLEVVGARRWRGRDQEERQRDREPAGESGRGREVSHGVRTESPGPWLPSIGERRTNLTGTV